MYMFKVKLDHERILERELYPERLRERDQLKRLVWEWQKLEKEKRRVAWQKHQLEEEKSRRSRLTSMKCGS